jgi:hypothetical protein
MNYDWLQSCPSLQLLQSFFQNIALKGYLTQCSPSAPPEHCSPRTLLPQNTAPPEHGFHQNTASIRTLLPSEHGYHCFNFTILRNVDPKQPSNFHFDLSLKLSQGEVHDFSGEVQKFSGGCKTISGEVRTSPHLPSKSGLARTLLPPEHCFHQNTAFSRTLFPPEHNLVPRLFPLRASLEERPWSRLVTCLPDFGR